MRNDGQTSYFGILTFKTINVETIVHHKFAMN